MFKKNKLKLKYNFHEFWEKKRHRLENIFSDEGYSETAASSLADQYIRIAWEDAATQIASRRTFLNFAANMVGFGATGALLEAICALHPHSKVLPVAAGAIAITTTLVVCRANDAHLPEDTKPSAKNNYQPWEEAPGCKSVYRAAEIGLERLLHDHKLKQHQVQPGMG